MNKELQEFLESLFGKDMLTLGEGQEMSQEAAVSLIQNLVSSRNELQTSVDNLTTEKILLRNRLLI